MEITSSIRQKNVFIDLQVCWDGNYSKFKMYQSCAKCVSRCEELIYFCIICVIVFHLRKTLYAFTIST